MLDFSPSPDGGAVGGCVPHCGVFDIAWSAGLWAYTHTWGKGGRRMKKKLSCMEIKLMSSALLPLTGTSFPKDTENVLLFFIKCDVTFLLKLWKALGDTYGLNVPFALDSRARSSLTSVHLCVSYWALLDLLKGTKSLRWQCYKWESMSEKLWEWETYVSEWHKPPMWSLLMVYCLI